MSGPEGGVGDPVGESSADRGEAGPSIEHTGEKGAITVTMNDADDGEPLALPTIIDGSNDSASPLPTFIDGYHEQEMVEVEPRWDRSGRCSCELTLCFQRRSNTETTVGEDPVCLWTESDEADFCDTMYHNGFKWRVAMLSCLAVSVCLVMLVDPCLTTLGVLSVASLLLVVVSQVIAQRMKDRRRARNLGQLCLLVLIPAYGMATLPVGYFASSGASPAWNGAQCTHEAFVTNMEGGVHPLHVLNLIVGPAGVFVGVMVTFMTISARGFLVVVLGCEFPRYAAYVLVAVNLPSPATTSPIPAAVLATVSMAACFAGGATIGCMYVVLQRQAAIKSAAVSLTTTAEVAMPARAPNRLSHSMSHEAPPSCHAGACRASQRPSGPARTRKGAA